MWNAFFFFFPVVFAVRWWLPTESAIRWFLIAASLVLVGYLSVPVVVLLLVCTAINYFLSLRIPSRKYLYVLSLVFNVAILFFYKYDGTMLGRLPGDLAVPIGLSFYTLLMLAYLTDIFLGIIAPEKNIGDFLFFSVFFPKVIAGPIVRGTFFLPQIHRSSKLRDVNVRYFVLLFLIGLFKKICVADNLTFIFPLYQGNPSQFDELSGWSFIVFSQVVGYCDISGYSDMAIASAGLLGFHLPQNFRFPLFSTNLFVFWTRWHITVSNWFRVFIYQPLGRTPGIQIPMFLRMILTCLVAGLWHGWGWNYLGWGLVHGTGICFCYVIVVNNYWPRFWSYLKAPRFVSVLLAIATTFLFCAFASTVYESDSFEKTIWIWKSCLFGGRFGPSSLGVSNWWLDLIPLTGLHYFFYRNPLENITRRISLSTTVFLVLFLVIVIFLNRSGSSTNFAYGGI
jgi:alginate O-acetyltransferase complex protein AlgI